MAQAEKNWGERQGNRARNLGLVGIGAGIIFLPEIIGLSAVLAASGVIFERASKPKN